MFSKASEMLKSSSSNFRLITSAWEIKAFFRSAIFKVPSVAIFARSSFATPRLSEIRFMASGAFS